MRLPDRKLPLALLFAAAVLALLPLGCNESNTITSPVTAPAMSLAGAWSGTYRSHGACGAAPASATLEQEGSQVTGIFRAASCDIGGVLSGTVQGNVFVGKVSMTGCTGGAVSGTISGGNLTLTVGDFYKDLVAGDQEVMPGGSVTLQR